MLMAHLSNKTPNSMCNSRPEKWEGMFPYTLHKILIFGKESMASFTTKTTHNHPVSIVINFYLLTFSDLLGHSGTPGKTCGEADRGNLYPEWSGDCHTQALCSGHIWIW